MHITVCHFTSGWVHPALVSVGKLCLCSRHISILFWVMLCFYRKLETHYWPSPTSYPPPVMASLLCRFCTTGTTPQNARRKKRRESRQRTVTKLQSKLKSNTFLSMTNFRTSQRGVFKTWKNKLKMHGQSYWEVWDIESAGLTLDSEVGMWT